MLKNIEARNFLQKYDYSFFLISIIIFIVGVSNLYSATQSSLSPHLVNLYKIQIAYYGLSLFIGGLISFVTPKNFFRYAYIIYGLNILFLILVLVMGHKGMGARRWLLIGPIRIQPSEFMKISLVLVLGRWFSRNRPDQEINLKSLFWPFILAIVPALLVIVQPDLGTGGLILLIFSGMVFFRKLRWKTIAILSLIGLFCGGLGYQFALRPYQKKRIINFLDPAADARGSGYNAIQSKIAIGSGQIWGKGFMKSTQASLRYLPENQTDFVFSIFSEEKGFVGAFALIGLYLFLFYRFIRLSMAVNKVFESVVAIGLLSIFFWHTSINMAMVMGLFPIVGLPLPLMSYGGSSLLTFGIVCGIATSISNSRSFF